MRSRQNSGYVVGELGSFGLDPASAQHNLCPHKAPTLMLGMLTAALWSWMCDW